MERTQKQYDLQDRTLCFSKRIVIYVNALPRNVSNNEIAKQLMRSAGSVGANYIEAEEALSKKDFLMRIKISRKEAKETQYWITLSIPSNEQQREKEDLMREASELTKIFGAIVAKIQK